MHYDAMAVEEHYGVDSLLGLCSAGLILIAFPPSVTVLRNFLSLSRRIHIYALSRLHDSMTWTKDADGWYTIDARKGIEDSLITELLEDRDTPQGMNRYLPEPVPCDHPGTCVASSFLQSTFTRWPLSKPQWRSPISGPAISPLT